MRRVAGAESNKGYRLPKERRGSSVSHQLLLEEIREGKKVKKESSLRKERCT